MVKIIILLLNLNFWGMSRIKKKKVKNDLNQRFNKGIIWTHWLTALLIFALIALSLNTVGEQYLGKETIFKIHLFLGSFVFIFTIIRSYILLKAKQPDSLKTGSWFVDKLVVWNHYLFYLLLFAVSITGIAIMLTGNNIEAFISGNIDKIASPEDMPLLKYHVLIIAFLLLLLIIHIIGVIKHYIFTKENTLKRII